MTFTPTKHFELLAPGGDVNAIKAAILAGADAIYCGLNKFNARNRATNISLDDLNGIIRLAHNHQCKVFLTLNIIILQSEIPNIISILNHLVNTNIDGVIVQDLGIFHLLSTYYPSLDIHASTQMNTHNAGQIHFLKKLNAGRANVSRELDINGIKALTAVCHQNGMQTEVFVHGSYCISFSGLCYINSVFGGRSGNRGQCSQPCRDRYQTTPLGKHYPLNLKDNSAFFNLDDLADAGVDALKIEGRMKQCDYVYTVVRCWKNNIENFGALNRQEPDNKDLYKVFNRDFSNSYLKGHIDKDMFIESPRDHSYDHLSEIHDYATAQDREADEERLHEEKEAIFADVENKIRSLSISQAPLSLVFAGGSGSPLTVVANTHNLSFHVDSETDLVPLAPSDNQPKANALHLNRHELLKRLDFLNHTEYVIEAIDMDDLDPGLALSFKSFTLIKNRIFSMLNRSKKRVAPIEVPKLKKQKLFPQKPVLSVLISSIDDAEQLAGKAENLYIQLPNDLNQNISFWIDFFAHNPHITPWFPAVLIDNHYTAAIELLRKINPERIVTNNTGIAHKACDSGIPWIAGPYLNVTNNYSLLCLKERFNCHGAFISNEISKKQLWGIHPPPNFKLCYSIFHPIMLLTSRQCLFHQVLGCHKSAIDDECIRNCIRSATLSHNRHGSMFIHKTKGNYPCMYNRSHYLNTKIIHDFPNLFSECLIDLRGIQTETKIESDKAEIIKCFEHFMDGNPGVPKELNRLIHPTTNIQYRKGI